MNFFNVTVGGEIDKGCFEVENRRGERLDEREKKKKAFITKIITTTKVMYLLNHIE
jgi:hypothetical protein